jgi:kynureninase
MTSKGFHTGRDYADWLDANDELRSFRAHFVLSPDDRIYLDGNSLGRLSHVAAARLARAVESEWGVDLIGSWNAGWYTSPARVGDQIGQLIGAASGQVLVCDSTSVNLFKLVMAALSLRPDRGEVVTDALNFPSDLYVLQGCLRLLGGHHQLKILGQSDDVEADTAALAGAINERTALVTLSHVAFKSGFLYDAAAVTELAHQQGALVLWDLSHSVGAVPIELDRWGVDLAVGCTYKYLNGGPGSPAFLYVRRERQDSMTSNTARLRGSPAS